MNFPFKDFFLQKTSKDANIVLASTTINSLLGALFFLIVPRLIGPFNYGIFSTITATIFLAASISNFAMDTGVIKFANDSRSLERVKIIAFWSYCVIGITVSLFGFLFSKQIASFLHLENYLLHFQLSFLSLIFFLLTNYFIAVLQAQKEFLKSSILSLSSNIARLIFLSLIFYLFKSNVALLISAFFYVYIIPTILGFIWVNVKNTKVQKNEYLEFFKFNTPIALSLIISAIPYENYFLIKSAGLIYVGIYSAPFKIMSFAYQIGGNFSKVLASHYATSSSKENLKSVTHKLIPYIGLFICSMAFVFLYSGSIINLLFGHEYSQSSSILKILSVGFVFFFLSIIPSSLILYFFGKSQISLQVTVIKYLIFVVLLITLVPIYKANGAAFAFTLSEFASLIFMTTWSVIFYKRQW